MVLAEKARNSCAQGRAKISHHSGGEFVYEEIRKVRRVFASVSLMKCKRRQVFSVRFS
jgi:hypothetical protein